MQKRFQPSTKDLYTHQYRQNGKIPTNQQVPNHNSNLDLSLETYINDKKFIQVLRKKGIKSLFKIQAASFNFIFQGRDIIARDRTGSGKTLAFTLPVLQRLRQKKFDHRLPKMLVVLPTRQLAIQVKNQIQSLRFPNDSNDFQALVVYGKSSIYDNISRLRRGTDILVGTPGRLNDLVEKGAIQLDDLEVIVLDEADQMLKQGFQQQVEKIFQAIKKVNSRKVQTLLFSATVPDWIHNLSEKYQSKAKYINMISDSQIRTSKQIKHYAVQISRLGQGQVVKLVQQMIDKYGGFEKRILIFCQRKLQVDNLSKNLRIQNAPLHGDVQQYKRQKAYHAFKSGNLRCIVATNVAARGLDFPSVDLVVQMCPPLNTQEYIHRAGRTGRAGKPGACLTFFERTKSRLIYKIQNQARIKIEQVKIEVWKINQQQDRQKNVYPNERRDHYSDNRNNHSDDRRDYPRQRSQFDRYQNRNQERGRYQTRNQERNSYNNNRDPRKRQDYNRNSDFDSTNRRQQSRNQRGNNYSYNKFPQKQTPVSFKRSPQQNSDIINRKVSNSRSVSRSSSPTQKRQDRYSSTIKRDQNKQLQRNKVSSSTNQQQNYDY